MPTPRPAVVETPGATPEPAAASPQQVLEATQQVARVVEPMARNLRFSIDTATGKTIVTVVDDITNEVIRQIPGEEIVEIARALHKLQGLLLDNKA